MKKEFEIVTSRIKKGRCRLDTVSLLQGGVIGRGDQIVPVLPASAGGFCTLSTATRSTWPARTKVL